jgi:hypothetical protein
MPLARGDLIRRFAVTTIDGSPFDYDDTWQRRNLLLIALRPVSLSDAIDEYVSKVTSRGDLLADYEARCVITSEPVPDVVAPAVIVADRWGEVYLAAHANDVSDLPSADEIFECLRSVAHECPECQGEAR